MDDLSLHIMDIVENCLNAHASQVKIDIVENLVSDTLTLSIVDNGKGMGEEEARQALDPFTTSRTCRSVGLGLPLLKARAERCNGALSITSKRGEGTTITAVFQHGHMDRPRLGDITSTLVCIIAANPSLDLVYRHTVGTVSYELDTCEVRRIVGEGCFQEHGTLALITQDIRRGLAELAVERTRLFKAKHGYEPSVELM